MPAHVIKWDDAIHSEDELWVCQACGAELHTDCVSETCPACGSEPSDNEPTDGLRPQLSAQPSTLDQSPWRPSTMTADQFNRAIDLLCGEGGAKAMARALSRYHPSSASEKTIARLLSRLRNDQDDIPAWIADGVIDMLYRRAKECAELCAELQAPRC